MEKVIKQYRRYNEQTKSWISWCDLKDSDEEETLKFAISKGYPYQIRTLEQINIIGWGIDEQ
jgi:hypothetical protein